MLNALIMHALGSESMPFSLSDGDVLREEDNIKSFGERSTLIFPMILEPSRPLVFIINSLSVDDSMSRSSFVGEDDDEWMFFFSISASYLRVREKKYMRINLW